MGVVKYWARLVQPRFTDDALATIKLPADAARLMATWLRSNGYETHEDIEAFIARQAMGSWFAAVATSDLPLALALAGMCFPADELDEMKANIRRSAAYVLAMKKEEEEEHGRGTDKSAN